MEYRLDNEVIENGNVSNPAEVMDSSITVQEEGKLNFSTKDEPRLFNVNPEAPSESNAAESKELNLPRILVNDSSPSNITEQSSDGCRINASEYETPGTSLDKSMSNSYVTAKDKTSSGYTNSNFENQDSSRQTSLSGEASSNFPLSPENITVSSSAYDASSKGIPSVSISSPDDDVSLSLPINSTRRESTDPEPESDEEYFEEYHLPNTHENAFVRHLSFRRKVQTTPINAPDADRIEGLVRTGEFVRHGSIRKKILPEEEEEEEDHVDEDFECDNDSSNFSKEIERDIREFEKYLSREDLNNTPQDLNSNLDTFEKLKRTASTPKSGLKNDNDPSYNDDDIPSTENFEQNLSIEESTLRKIQECLDFSHYKDILNFSGRLSDILSPKEVEEVLSNSERYRQYLDTEVLEALSLSYQEQFHSLPCTVNLSKSSTDNNSKISSNSSSNKSLPNTDSGFSSPITPKKDEIDETPEESPKNSLHLVERNGISCDGIDAQGIFVETPASTVELKKIIPAPHIDLNSSSDTRGEEDDTFESDEKSFEEIQTKRKITIPKDILELSDNQDDLDITFETNDSREESNVMNSNPDDNIPPHEISAIPPPPDLIPELSASEEMSEVRHWRNVVIGGAWRRIDMKVVAPFRKCISHGGYMDDDSQSPIVVISAALLPDKTRKDYHYVMDNLFMYVLSFVEQLVADDYILVYFSGGKLSGSGPGFRWMRRAYEMIDRRLRKNLKSLLLVHPSLWARTILTLARPFISSKFYRKLKFVQHLTDLAMLVPLEQLEIPDAVKQADFEIMIREKKKLRSR